MLEVKRIKTFLDHGEHLILQIFLRIGWIDYDVHTRLIKEQIIFVGKEIGYYKPRLNRSRKFTTMWIKLI